MESIKIINVVKEKSTFRIVLETPQGLTRMWITDTDYKNNKIKEISSNAASYLEQFKGEIEEVLLNFKNS